MAIRERAEPSMMGSDEPAHVIVVEDNPSGHRLAYVRYLVNAGVAEGERLTLVLTPDVVESREFALHLSALSDSFDVVIEPRLQTPAEIRSVAHRLGATRTVVVDGDVLAARLGLLWRWRGPGTVAVLLMRDPRQQPLTGPGSFRRRAKRLAIGRARRLRGVVVISLRSALYRPVAGECVALDPVEADASDEFVEQVRNEWGVRPEVFWFSIIGAINARKNLPMVADALILASKQVGSTPTGLLVAGMRHESIRAETAAAFQRLAEAGILVVQVDRLLDNAQIDAAVRLSDCVVVAHSNEGPSGLVAKSALCGVRVAAAGALTLREDVGHLDSARWSVLDVPSMAAMFLECAAMPAPLPRTDLGVEQFCSMLLRGR